MHLQAMEEIHKLRAQISNIVHANFTDTDPGFTPKLPPPQDIQVNVATSCANMARS
jgi:ATP-dependent RNA helicase DHX37/DHR1